MKGKLIKVKGEWFIDFNRVEDVVFYEQVVNQQADWRFPVYPDRFINHDQEGKEVEFELIKVDSKEGKKQRALHQSSTPYEFTINKIQMAKIL